MTDDISSLPRVALPNGIRIIPWDPPPKLGNSTRTETDTRIR